MQSEKFLIASNTGSPLRSIFCKRSVELYTATILGFENPGRIRKALFWMTRQKLPHQRPGMKNISDATSSKS